MIRFFTLLLLLVGFNAHATTYIDCDFDSAPSSETTGGVYTCDTGSLTIYLRNTTGSTNGGHDYISNEGWSGGAAKFYLHTALTDSDRQLTFSSYTSSTQQNWRFLIKYEDATALAGKWLDEGNVAGHWRTWLSFESRSCGMSEISPELAYDGTIFMLHSGGLTSNPCGSYYWCPNSSWGEGWYSPAGATDCTEYGDRLDLANYENEWVAMELEKKSNGDYGVYVWTQDGVFDGIYYRVETTNGENLIQDSIGVYSEGSFNNEWFYIDEVRVDDEYIGPPVGFGSGGSTETGIGGSGTAAAINAAGTVLNIGE